MPKVTWDREEEEIPTVSARTKASRRNVATARAVKEENARKRNMQKMKAEQDRLQREIEVIHKEKLDEINKQTDAIMSGMEEKMVDAALSVVANAGKKVFRELAREAAWKVYIEAGGIERHEEIVKGDDQAFLRHFRDVIVPLSKGDNNEDRGRTIVKVNIIGAPGGDVNVAMQMPSKITEEEEYNK